VLTAARALGGLVLLKAVDVALRGPVSGRLWLVGLVLLAAAGAALLAGWDRGGWVLMVAGAVATAVDAPVELRRQHLVLLALVGLAALAARTPVERRLLWSVQLSALYGVAALAKLNEPYLAGTVLGAAVAPAPVRHRPARGAARCRCCSPRPWGCCSPRCSWRSRPGCAGCAARGWSPPCCSTPPPCPLAGHEPLVALRLVVFGGTAVCLLFAVTRPRPTVRTAGP
jgi:hypothetical protein